MHEQHRIAPVSGHEHSRFCQMDWSAQRWGFQKPHVEYLLAGVTDSLYIDIKLIMKEVVFDLEISLMVVIIKERSNYWSVQ